jgi:ABC-type branched-subunit amino acid transport system substrate-binding protein
MAENLAKELFARGVRRCAVLHTKDQYNLSFAAAFSERMRRSGGEVEVEVEVDSGLRTYPEALNMLREETSIVLAAPAEVAARVVNEFYAAQRSPTWLLTPALRSEAFVLNASPEALEGALGIAPELKVDSRFAAAFSEHFQGDVPLDSALYYYDAAALFVRVRTQRRAAPLVRTAGGKSVCRSVSGRRGDHMGRAVTGHRRLARGHPALLPRADRPHRVRRGR